MHTDDLSRFSAPDRAALHVADAMTRDAGRVPDPVWAEAASHWSATALVEIVAMAAAFAMFNRIAEALELEVV